MTGLAYLILTGLCTLPMADDPLVTDRPDFTESAVAVPSGRIQLESGYTFARTGIERSHSIGEFLIRIGSGRRTEIRIGLNSLTSAGLASGWSTGVEDASIGFKHELYRRAEGKGLSKVAIIGALTLPTGSVFHERALQPEAKLCFAGDLTERLGFSSNLNVALLSEGGKRFSQFSGSASLGFDLSDRVGSYVEYFGFLPASRGGPNLNYLNAGLTYLANADLQIDARAGIGLNSTTPDYFVGAGVARRW